MTDPRQPALPAVGERIRRAFHAPHPAKWREPAQGAAGAAAGVEDAERATVEGGREERRGDPAHAHEPPEPVLEPVEARVLVAVHG